MTFFFTKSTRIPYYTKIIETLENRQWQHTKEALGKPLIKKYFMHVWVVNQTSHIKLATSRIKGGTGC